MTGPAFQGANLPQIGGRVLVPSSTWKAIYIPATGDAGAWSCTNTATPECAVLSVADLTVQTGVDPFPACRKALKRRSAGCPCQGRRATDMSGDFMLTPRMTPYADDAASMTIGDLTLENGRDCVAVGGSLDLTRDKAGLVHARALKAALDAIVHALESDGALPDKVTPPKAPTEVKNPFG